MTNSKRNKNDYKRIPWTSICIDTSYWNWLKEKWKSVISGWIRHQKTSHKENPRPRQLHWQILPNNERINNSHQFFKNLSKKQRRKHLTYPINITLRKDYRKISNQYRWKLLHKVLANQQHTKWIMTKWSLSQKCKVVQSQSQCNTHIKGTTDKNHMIISTVAEKSNR